MAMITSGPVSEAAMACLSIAQALATLGIDSETLARRVREAGSKEAAKELSFVDRLRKIAEDVDKDVSP
jgi:hypothetical protein